MILSLTETVINRLDTGEAISARTIEGSRSQEFSVPFEVRRYANGRMRAVSSPGEAGALTYTFTLLTLDQIETLRSWKGVAVQLRDHRGQKWFGAFGTVRPIELKDPRRYNAEITIQTITYAEGV